MQFALTPDLREFFNKNSYIELQGLLSADQVALLRKNADETLSARLRLPVSKLAELSTVDLFKTGYDLWRNNEEIKKIVHKKSLATLAAELFQTLPIRLAFDEYIYTSGKSTAPFSESFPLQETSCLSPLAGALVIPLEDLSQPLPFFPLPLNTGNGLFISPSLPIPWKQLYSTPGLRFLILGYGMKKTFFRPDTRDPHAVNLKMLGYVFNDCLRESHHPLLLRK